MKKKMYAIESEKLSMKQSHVLPNMTGVQDPLCQTEN